MREMSGHGKKNGISEPTVQALYEIIDPKTFFRCSRIWKRFYDWIYNSENAFEMNRSLICDFLLEMYNKVNKHFC